MFSFLGKKSLVKRAVLVGAVLVLLTGFLFVSCIEPEPDPTPIIPQGLDISYLHGTWYAANNGGDFYIIDKTAKTFEYVSGYSTDYNGKIVDVVKQTSSTGTSGVIYIKFTTKPIVYSTGDPVDGDYTGIYFNLVKPSENYGFYLPVDEEYTPVTTSTLAAAKTTLSLADFDTYVLTSVEYAKLDGGNGGVHSSPLEGSWADDYGSIFTITKTTVVSAADLGSFVMTSFAGDIFKVVTNGNAGYIVFRYVGVTNPALVGTYSVLAWKNLDSDSVEMAFAGDEYTGGIEAGETTAAEAEEKYSSGSDDDFDYTEFSKQ